MPVKHLTARILAENCKDSKEINKLFSRALQVCRF